MASARAVNISPTSFLVQPETMPSYITSEEEKEEESTCRPSLFIETDDKSPETQAYEEALLLEEFLRNNATPLQEDISGAGFKIVANTTETTPGIIRVSSKKTLNRVVSFSDIVEQREISPND